MRVLNAGCSFGTMSRRVPPIDTLLAYARGKAFCLGPSSSLARPSPSPGRRAAASVIFGGSSRGTVVRPAIAGPLPLESADACVARDGSPSHRPGRQRSPYSSDGVSRILTPPPACHAARSWIAARLRGIARAAPRERQSLTADFRLRYDSLSSRATSGQYARPRPVGPSGSSFAPRSRTSAATPRSRPASATFSGGSEYSSA
jgi:hypothetical protein